MKLSPDPLLNLLITFGYGSTSEQILFLFLLLLSLPHVLHEFPAFITHCFLPLYIVEDYLARKKYGMQDKLLINVYFLDKGKPASAITS